MVNFNDAIRQLLSRGYHEDSVEEKIAQDVILKALQDCGFKNHVTIKGGVVMANLTKDVRRTTLDVDIDFVRAPLTDETIRELVDKMNCVDGVTISLVGDIVELKQHDYHGKRIFLSIMDTAGNTIESKMDIGVHTVQEADQREMPFVVESIGLDVAVLFANTPEQIFVEKLKSLLRLGPVSNRAKDIDDMLYLSESVNHDKLMSLIKVYIYDDVRMVENDIHGIVHRMQKTFSDPRYIARISHRRANWLQVSPAESTKRLLSFVRSLSASSI